MRVISPGIYAFDKEGVVVTIPPELGDIIPRQLELDWSPDMWRQEFRPLRLVINLKFVDPNVPEQTYFKFSTPIKVRVHYTPDERYDAVKRGTVNSLAVWMVDRWEPLAISNDVFPVLGRGWAGFLEFEIMEWDDPTIAMG